jgi:serine/threonine protein kinase
MTTTPRPTSPPPTPAEPSRESAPTHGAEITAGVAPSGKGADPLQRIGDFTILGKLGEGGMGTVYRAEDPRLKRKAAIKTMKPELAAKPENRERFLQEAQAAAAVEHDNIVSIWQIGELADGSLFIAMPLLQGEMLDDRLKRERVLSLGVLLKVIRDVADGLAAAHAKGLIHRDIKPSNVWLEGDPAAKEFRRCKILDFGLARSVVADDMHLTASGMILGTPAYMAPEQGRGEAVDHRADLFSLGVLLYRMAAGRLPFEGTNVMAVLTALATVTPAPLGTLKPTLPPALSDLCDRLLCKDPAGRPQSAAEVAATVRRIARDLQPKPSAPVVPVATAVLVPTATLRPADSPWEDITSEGHESVHPMPLPKPKSWRTPMIVVAACLLALVPLGWWLATVIRVETAEGTLLVRIDDPEVEARIKSGRLILTSADGKDRYTLTPVERTKRLGAGPYKIRVEGADGLVVDTPKFEMKKGGKVTVRVTMEAKAVAKGEDNRDPDRRAAEYVLSIGGVVRVNEEEKDIKAVAELPKEMLRLTWVELAGNT